MKGHDSILGLDCRVRLCRAHLFENASRLEVLAAECQRKGVESDSILDSFGFEIQASALRLCASNLREQAECLDAEDLSPDLELNPSLFFLNRSVDHFRHQLAGTDDQAISATYRLEIAANILAIRWITDHPPRTFGKNSPANSAALPGIDGTNQEAA